MKLDDLRSSENVDDRRGSSGGGMRIPGGGGKVGIGGLVIVLALSYFTGINPLTLLNGYQSIAGSGQAPSSQVTPQAGRMDDQSSDLVRRVLGSTEDSWNAIFREQGVNKAYTPPRLVLFSGLTFSACGTAQSAMGPFYCPNDRKIYLDTEFFDQMRNHFNACPQGQGACAFAQAYVIAHEVGHHVQNLLGILDKVHTAQAQASRTEANRLSVRLELQADCLAGVWANRTQKDFRFIEQGDVEAALQTANAIGDDMLQKTTQGRVVPDSFTHGTSAQRQKWFMTGFQNGAIASCLDTFKVPEQQL